MMLRVPIVKYMLQAAIAELEGMDPTDFVNINLDMDSMTDLTLSNRIVQVRIAARKENENLEQFIKQDSQ